jgi:1,4-alpha-glucan branching enzyme
MTAEPRSALRVAMPEAGPWHEILNSDAAFYGGSGVGNLGRVQATAQPVGDWPASALVSVPPLATVVLCNRPIPTIAPTREENDASQ